MPQLKSVDECVNVPSEVCATSKVNPKKKKRPTIQKWCYRPQECSLDADCTTGNVCNDNKCVPSKPKLTYECGDTIDVNNAYIQNQDYPNRSPSGSCEFNIKKHNNDVCQFK